MKLNLPANFPIPENARPGEPFEVVATITPGEDGGFNLTAIDGIELSDEEEEMEGPTPVNEYNDASGVQLPF